MQIYIHFMQMNENRDLILIQFLLYIPFTPEQIVTIIIIMLNSDSSMQTLLAFIFIFFYFCRRANVRYNSYQMLLSCIRFSVFVLLLLFEANHIDIDYSQFVFAYLFLDIIRDSAELHVLNCIGNVCTCGRMTESPNRLVNEL